MGINAFRYKMFRDIGITVTQFGFADSDTAEYRFPRFKLSPFTRLRFTQGTEL